MCLVTYTWLLLYLVHRCSMALVHSRIGRVFYGCSDPATGGLGSQYKIHTQQGINHHFEVYSRVLEQQCLGSLSCDSWYLSDDTIYKHFCCKWNWARLTSTMLREKLNPQNKFWDLNLNTWYPPNTSTFWYSEGLRVWIPAGPIIFSISLLASLSQNDFSVTVIQVHKTRWDSCTCIVR